MRSKASIKGHSLHPMLVSFPIAFFTGALVFDLLRWISGKIFYSDIAEVMIVAGIIGSIAAAIPGVIDYLYTVPPKSSGKKRAAKHGITNVCVLLIFAGTLIYRTHNGQDAITTILLLEAVAVGLMVFAGWMGGTLVARNQIGVDHRFAEAGKWKELHLQAQDGRVEITDFGELKTDQMMLVHVDGKRIVVARTESGFAAFDDHCPHRGGSLAGGAMICGTVQCPWHGSQFDVHSGAPKAGPAKTGIPVYALQLAGGKLYLQLPVSNP
ncbi:DUF2231 domain-containing protein [Chitinophaga pollutisoli]|uniref:DUF2231 domain-containing protein n=1 Tax=Chitinophaga pollutisoli TaxID=3133966 RepID=A0ABZ2YLX1_9BACT